MNMENGQYKISMEQRMTRVETRLDDIIDNHLAHIQKDIDIIKERIAYYAGGISIIVVMASYFMSKFF